MASSIATQEVLLPVGNNVPNKRERVASQYGQLDDANAAHWAGAEAPVNLGAGINALANKGIKIAKSVITYTELNTAGTGVAHLDGDIIPSGAVIINVAIDVTASFSDTGTDISTVKLGIEDQDNDVLAAAALADLEAADAITSLVVLATPGSYLTLTADRRLAATFTRSAGGIVLDAGSMTVYTMYITP